MEVKEAQSERGNVDEMSEQVSKTMQQKWKTIQTNIYVERLEYIYPANIYNSLYDYVSVYLCV